jgi:hypothetical protein
MIILARFSDGMALILDGWLAVEKHCAESVGLPLRKPWLYC